MAIFITTKQVHRNFLKDDKKVFRHSQGKDQSSRERLEQHETRPMNSIRKKAKYIYEYAQYNHCIYTMQCLSSHVYFPAVQRFYTLVQVHLVCIYECTCRYVNVCVWGSVQTGQDRICVYVCVCVGRHEYTYVYYIYACTYLCMYACIVTVMP